MKYTAWFATREQCHEWQVTRKMPPASAAVPYLKAEPIRENSMIFKLMLYYKHCSLYSLSEYWAYLTKDDLRSIEPFKEWQEKNIPFYITYGDSFHEVRDIRVNENGILELIVQHAAVTNLN